MPSRFAALTIGLVVLVASAVWYFGSRNRAAQPEAKTGPTSRGTPSPGKSGSVLSTSAQASASSDKSPTNIYAHNLLLRKGPNFRVYVRWLRGQMTPTHRNVTPSFDDLESFFLDIETGVLRANIGDLGNFLNASGLANSPLKNITLSGDGDQIKLTGTLHKIVPLPIEMTGTLSIVPDNKIQIHVTKLGVLKIPVKGLLGDFHLTLADLFHPQGIAGLQVSGNDILLDTQTLLPPPHIRGNLTKVHIVNPDLEEVYGNAANDVTRVEQWRNFLRLRNGSIDFGKLTMHYVDLIMIDISNDAWFDLDLANYQAQLVNGYTRMTPEAGLQIFMPDKDKLPHTKANQNVSVEWLKNRNEPPPPDVTQKQ
ncbi:MAG: hypothetical protein JO210_01760 [Acidobacteriaceae bacterium]|nr:hypothetical protein [Acidobacteriaceae bacterium]